MARIRTNPVQVGFSDAEHLVLLRAAKLRRCAPAHLIYQAIKASLPQLEAAVKASEAADRQISEYLKQAALA